MADEIIVQVDAPHFCAGLVFKNGVVISTAPILSWAMGKDIEYLAKYFKKKGWKTDARKINPRNVDVK